MKKRWFVIPVAAGMLALVVTGGAIFAQENGTGPGGKVSQLTTRVAEILGLEPSVVQDAFQQAMSEQHEARLQTQLDRLVFTQDQADAVMNWYQARPEAAMHLRRAVFGSEESVQRILNHLVEAERITQAEADEVLAWHQIRPDVLPAGFTSPNKEFRGHFRGQFKGQMHQRGIKFGDTGETDPEVSQQSFRNFAPDISTQGVWQ